MRKPVLAGGLQRSRVECAVSMGLQDGAAPHVHLVLVDGYPGDDGSRLDDLMHWMPISFVSTRWPCGTTPFWRPVAFSPLLAPFRCWRAVSGATNPRNPRYFGRIEDRGSSVWQRILSTGCGRYILIMKGVQETFTHSTEYY